MVFGIPIKIFSKRLAIGFFTKEGVAFFKDKNKKGLINSSGQIIIPAVYKELVPFTKGLVKAQKQNGKWGVLNFENQTILPFNYLGIGPFSEGLVALKKEHKDGIGWVYGDLNGDIVIPGYFTEASVFHGDHALVKPATSQEAKETDASFIINRQGKKVDFNGGEAKRFSEGLFCVTQAATEHQYYANAAGLNVFGRYFQEIEPFQLGIAKVRRLPMEGAKKELLGAINKRGVMVVPPKFRYLHIQPTGNITINPQRYFGLLDKQGKVLLEPVYDKIERFENFQIFRVERGESIGYVRLVDGKCIWVWALQK